MTDLDQIKQKIDIVSFISESIPLKKAGVNFKGVCPFHNEKTPSFVVSPERQIWHCFGACQEGGDIFKFLMKIENIEFSESLKILAKRAGIPLSQTFQSSKTADQKEKIYHINNLASQFYNYLLTTHPLGQKARDYLANRLITNNSIKLFNLGYSPNSWDSLFKFLSKKNIDPLDAIAAGIISKSAIGHYFDRFRGRLMFPLFDHRRNIVGFSARLLEGQSLPADRQESKYINTAETIAYTKGNTLYGLNITHDEIKKEGFAVVVEGEIDAIQSYQAGVRNVVAIKGSALTDGQISLLKRFTENISLSLDADYAGDNAVHRGIISADTAGLNIKVVTFDEAKDPDELIKNFGPASWREAVKSAINFHDFIIDSAIQKFDPKKPDDIKKITADVAKFLIPIDNLVVKNHYLKKLADLLNVSPEDLETQLEREYKKNQFTRRSDSEVGSLVTSVLKSRTELLGEYLLSILLQSPKPSDYLLLISARLSADDFSPPALGKIYQLLDTFSLENPKFDIKNFAKIVPDELLPTIDRLYLNEIKINPDDDPLTLKEVQKTARDLKDLSLRDKLKSTSLQIKNDPISNEFATNFSDISAKLSRLIEEKALLENDQNT